jgi:predicted MFS family arabinose efflux permease
MLRAMESPAQRDDAASGGAGERPGDGDYAWFSAGVASWFGAFGMQSAIFAWLLVGVLEAPAHWVGIAQTSNMLPSLFLVLVGGAVADRRDPRRMLIGLHLLMIVPVLLLLFVVVSGKLDIGTLIALGFAQGTITAFVVPSRDTLLSRVAGRDMMRAVTGMTLFQFGSQSVGTLLVGTARWIGSPAILCIQAATLALGALATFFIHGSKQARPPAPAHSPLSGIAEGLRIVARTPHLRVPIGLVLAVGTLFVGPFLVVFPILVRDVYHGTEVELSLVLSLFPLGTIVGSGLILLRGGIARKGLGALNALTLGAVALATVGLAPPFWGMVLATFVWGLGGSVFINCSRTLYQQAAPRAQRGQVLSIYQLGFMGAAPLGALAAGFSSELLGPANTLLGFAAAMFTVVTLAWTRSDAPRMH